MLRKKKFLIGGILIFAAIGYLAFVGFKGSSIYYLTVSELQTEETIKYEQKVRVNGMVSEYTVDKDSDSGRTVNFTLSEGGASLAVMYNGILPDAFQNDIDVVVEGSLNEGGYFLADNILVKCPSKYTAADE